MIWQLWRTWPATLPFTRLSELTDDEVAWLGMQAEIDAGLQYCEPCDEWGWHTFCGYCGRRYLGHDREWRRCPNRECRASVSTDWCPMCGTQVSSEKLRQFERGEIDLEAESQRAMAELEKLYQARPDLAPESYAQGQASLESAVMSVFGQGA